MIYGLILQSQEIRNPSHGQNHFIIHLFSSPFKSNFIAVRLDASGLNGHWLLMSFVDSNCIEYEKLVRGWSGNVVGLFHDWTKFHDRFHVRDRDLKSIHVRVCVRDL